MKLKSDRFKRSREGRSQLLDISCAKCGRHLFDYQKDGAGILKRAYYDRILGTNVGKGNLICPNCKTLLGVPMVYKKENRQAIRLLKGAVSKKVAK